LPAASRPFSLRPGFKIRINNTISLFHYSQFHSSFNIQITFAFFLLPFYIFILCPLSLPATAGFVLACGSRPITSGFLIWFVIL